MKRPGLAGKYLREYNPATDHEEIEINGVIHVTFFYDRDKPDTLNGMTSYGLLISDLNKFISFMDSGEEDPRDTWAWIIHQVFQQFPNSPWVQMRDFKITWEISFRFDNVQIKNNQS